MPAGSPALRLQGIAKAFGRTPVLRRVDLEVAPGETVAILGSNGAGKTTLLRIAATLARPGAGNVLVAGIDARLEPEQARARLSVLTQEAPLYPELTALEHARWWAKAQASVGPAPGHRAVPQVAELQDAGLADVMGIPVRALSRGERQRLALVLALLPHRPLLILDEPFAALDGKGQAWLEGKLLERRQAGGATLLTAHDEAQARRIADRMLRLRDGTLHDDAMHARPPDAQEDGSWSQNGTDEGVAMPRGAAREAR